MAWLTPLRERWLRMAGFPAEHPLVESAEAFAEQMVHAYTDAVFGVSTAFSDTVMLTARTHGLPCKLDVSAITSITHNDTLLSALQYQIQHGYIYAHRADYTMHLWQIGVYTISCTRGITAVPEQVIRAAALLAAYYMRLSDPERSQYLNYARGDFSGTARLAELPVPEAAQLLNRYRDVAEASLA